MKRFVIREIATGNYLCDNHISAKTTPDPGQAKQWKTYDGAYDAIKDVTHGYHFDQLKKIHKGNTQNFMLQQQNFAAIYELVEIDFTAIIAATTPVAISVSNGPAIGHGFNLIEVS